MSLNFVPIAPKTSDHFTPSAQTKVQQNKTPPKRDLKPAWTHNASAALISIVEDFIEDLEHPRRKKLVFKNVSKILASMGFPNYSAIQCHQKWKTLLRTYRANKNSSNQGLFYFYETMDRLLSKKPLAAPKLTLESNDSCNFESEEQETIEAHECQETIEDEVHNEDDEEIQNDEEEEINHNEDVEYENATISQEVEPVADGTLNQILEFHINDDDEENDKSKIIPIANTEDDPMECPDSKNIDIVSMEAPTRTGWSYDASIAFINIMEEFVKDIENPGKRKNVFNRVCDRLITMGIEGFTPEQCQHKWRNLIRTYKVHKLNRAKVGTLKKFYFYDQMDRLIGHRFDTKTNSAKPQIEQKFVKIVNPLPMKKYIKIEPAPSANIVQRDGASVPQNVKIGAPRISNNFVAPEQKSGANVGNVVNGQPCVVMMCSHEDAREKARQKRHDERMALEKERCQIEKRKVSLLEQILARLA